MEGPMVALLMPFKPNTLEIDDAAFVKYLDVCAILLGFSQHDNFADGLMLLRCLAASVGRWHQKCGGQRVGQHCCSSIVTCSCMY